MKQHEREFFISSIRTGTFFLRNRGTTLKVLTPTLEEEYWLNQTYNDAYEAALNDGIMTEENMSAWLGSQGLWTDEEEKKLTDILKTMDRLKIAIYHDRG